MKCPGNVINFGNTGLLAVYRNKRKAPDDFTKTKYYVGCNFCDSFVEYVANISTLKNTMGLAVCKSCLTKMIGEIDKQYITDMKGEGRE